MMILVSGATATVERYPEVGCLVSPAVGNSIERLAASGRTWAADNGCFRSLDVPLFWRMLRRIAAADRDSLQWVTCPDVVGHAQATINRWTEWFPQIEALGLPAAFVGQDGLESITDQIQWHEITCFFVGGSDEWKLSHHAARLMVEAKRRGKLVHVGRVNTRKRIRHVLASCPQADSIDGRAFSAWPDQYIPRGLAWIREAKRQPVLF